MISVIEELKEIDLINVFSIKNLKSSHKHIFEIFSYLLHFSIFDWKSFKENLNLYELKYKMQTIDFSKYEHDRINNILNKISHNKVICNEIFDNTFISINIFFKWIKATLKVYLFEYQNETQNLMNKKADLNLKPLKSRISPKIINNNVLFKTSNGFSNFKSTFDFEKAGNNDCLTTLSKNSNTLTQSGKSANKKIIITNTREETQSTHHNDEHLKIKENGVNQNVYINEYASVETSINSTRKSSRPQKDNKPTNLPVILHEKNLKLGPFTVKKVIRNDDNFIPLMNTGNYLQLKKAFDLDKLTLKNKQAKAKVLQNYIEEIDSKGKKKLKLKNLEDLAEVVIKGNIRKIEPNYYKKFCENLE